VYVDFSSMNKVDTLIQLLTSFETLLRSVGEVFWADNIKNILDGGAKVLN